VDESATVGTRFGFDLWDNRSMRCGILGNARRTCPRRTQDVEAASSLSKDRAGFLDSKCMFGLQSLGALALGTVCLSGAIYPLRAQTTGTPDQESDTLRGTVVNSLTHEPIGRALVYSPDNRYAAMTDGQGRFEFKFARAEREPNAGFVATSNVGPSPPYPRQYGAANRPSMLMARKTGFLPDNDGQQASPLSATQQELTIPLAPEALIIGHILLPESDGSNRIQVELFRRQVREGREQWDSVGTVMSRSDGEYRFAELSAGSYKLVTHELLDRDPLAFNPSGQLFGYPPVYYAAATDFTTASVIRLSAGSTTDANVSPARREYYAVKVPVGGAPLGLPIRIQVWLQGHEGPGYSLGYNAEEQLIQGLLPDGAYVVRATARGSNAMTGMSTLTVKGAAVEGPALMMLPNSSILVSVREEFQHRETATQGPMVADGIRNASGNARRPGYLQVSLLPIEEFGFAPGAFLRPPRGPDDDSPLLIENVQPGRYRVVVNTAIGFASSVTSNGTDLEHQPLVVTLGGATPPIEITVRDDGAEVEGAIVGASTRDAVGFRSPGQSPGNVYFIPTTGSSGQFRVTWVSPDGKFQLQQLPPGVYRVLAFDRQQPDLEYASEEALSKYEAKAQVIRVVAGQKEHLQMPLITQGE
jgi:hypothetical protein